MRFCLSARQRRGEEEVECVIVRIQLKLPESHGLNAIQYEAVDKLIKHWHTLEI